MIVDTAPATAHRRVPWSRLAPELLVLCAFTLATVPLTYPLAWHLRDSLPGFPPIDNFHYLWELWYPAHAIFDLHSSPFVDPKIYSPFGFDLIRSQDMSPATVLLFAPLTRAVGEVVAYNLIVLMSFPLTAFGTYLFARELWGSRLAALVAGTAVGFCTYRVSHALGHLSLVTTQWIPFFLFYVERTIKRPTLRHGLLTGVFYGLSALVSWYYAVGSALSALLYVTVRLRRTDLNEPKPLLRAAAVAVVVALLMVTPFAVLYMNRVTSGEMANRPPVQQQTFAASVADFVIPSASHPVWGRWISRHWRSGANGQWPAEWQIYLGAVLLALGLFGVCVDRSRPVVALLVMGFGMFVLALGPSLQLTHRAVGGAANAEDLGSVALPVRVLSLVPPFSLLRGWSRMGIFVEIAVALLAARGVIGLFARVPRLFASHPHRWRVAVTALVVTLSVVDTLAVPYQRSRVVTRAVDRWLAAELGDFATIEYPVIEHGYSGPAMYRRRITGKRTVLGYGSYPPNEEFWPTLSRFPADDTLDLLQWWDVKYVLVDESLYRSGAEFWGVRHTWNTLRSEIQRTPRLIERAVFDGIHVYTIAPGSAQAIGDELLKNPGFEDVSGDAPSQWGRIGSPGDAFLDAHAHSGRRAVSVTPSSFFVSRQIPITEGQCYLVRQLSRGMSVNDRARLQVNWVDASGREMGSAAAAVRLFNAYPAWRGATASVRAPEGSRAARIYAAAHRGRVWFDDYSFREADGGCSSGSVSAGITANVRSATPTIVANPNPVSSAQDRGRTTISWDTGNQPPGQVFVSEDGGPEILFAGTSRYGSQEALWIGAGKSYEFRLYAGEDRSRRLASVVVKSRDDWTLIASPNPVPAGADAGTTRIAWNTGDSSVGEVFVSVDGGPEVLFARSPQGSQEATWIGNRSTYVFRLYRIARGRTLLGSITVRREP
jgi:hypothetical protein